MSILLADLSDLHFDKGLCVVECQSVNLSDQFVAVIVQILVTGIALPFNRLLCTIDLFLLLCVCLVQRRKNRCFIALDEVTDRRDVLPQEDTRGLA